METKKINRNLSLFDLFPSYVQKANNVGFSSEVFLDFIPEGREAIGTHSGGFHSDETLAVSMLRTLPEFKNHVVVRTRNQDILNKCDIVVDVGGIFDPEKKRFDHHQKGFMETFDEKHNTKLSSAGLVFRHYGKNIISALASHPLSESDLEVVHKKLYDSFVEEVDGNDNGVDAYTGTTNYSVTTNLPRRVKRLAPAWNEPSTPEIELERFRLAMGLMLGEFAERLHGIVDIKLPAREIVAHALECAESVHPSKEILILDKECPFMDHLCELEKEQGIEGRTKFVIVQNKDGSWRIRGINLANGSFELRQKLLPKFLGLRDEELSKACGIPECVFVHISGFMGINKTKEGALQMAIQSLQ